MLFRSKLMDFFATPANEQDLVYGELYKEKESCYLVEFQDFSEKDCAIYDADTRDFTYYKKTDGGGLGLLNSHPQQFWKRETLLK